MQTTKNISLNEIRPKNDENHKQCEPRACAGPQRLTQKHRFAFQICAAYNLFISCKQIILSVNVTSSTLSFHFCRCRAVANNTWQAGAYSNFVCKKYYSKIKINIFHNKHKQTARNLYHNCSNILKTSDAHDRNMFQKMQ